MSCARPAAHQPAAGLVKANGTYGRPRVARPRRAWDAPRTSVGLSTYRGRGQGCSLVNNGLFISSGRLVRSS